MEYPLFNMDSIGLKIYTQNNFNQLFLDEIKKFSGLSSPPVFDSVIASGFTLLAESPTEEVLLHGVIDASEEQVNTIKLTIENAIKSNSIAYKIHFAIAQFNTSVYNNIRPGCNLRSEIFISEITPDDYVLNFTIVRENGLREEEVIHIKKKFETKDYVGEVILLENSLSSFLTTVLIEMFTGALHRLISFEETL